jgi:hypothetical protein
LLEKQADWLNVGAPGAPFSAPDTAGQRIEKNEIGATNATVNKDPKSPKKPTTENFIF